MINYECTTIFAFGCMLVITEIWHCTYLSPSQLSWPPFKSPAHITAGPNCCSEINLCTTWNRCLHWTLVRTGNRTNCNLFDCFPPCFNRPQPAMNGWSPTYDWLRYGSTIGKQIGRTRATKKIYRANLDLLSRLIQFDSMFRMKFNSLSFFFDSLNHEPTRKIKRISCETHL